MSRRRKLNSGDPRKGGSGGDGDRSAGGEFYGPNPDNAAAVWVESDIHADGRYGITIRAGNIARGVSRSEAAEHAVAVLTLAQRAEYDAATMSLLTSLGLELSVVAPTIEELRRSRPFVDSSALAPLLLAPGVSHRTRKPFLTVAAGDMEIGQWTVDDARRHALFTLEVAEAVELDQGLFDYLTAEGDDGLGLDENRAGQVVATIADHRSPR